MSFEIIRNYFSVTKIKMIRMVFSYRHLHHRDEVLYIEQAFIYSMWNLKPYLPMVQTNKICVDIFICIAERTTTTTTLKIMLDRSISALDVLMVSFVSDGRNLPTNVTTHIWCLLCNLTTKSSLKYSSFPNSFFFFFFWPKGQHRFTTTPTTVLFSGVWFDRTYLSLYFLLYW